MSLLDLQGIGKRYGAAVALDGIDLSVPAGSRTAIVGPSGSGKTTLLRIVAGFEAPDTGRVTLDGQVMAQGPAAVAAHRRNIGVVPQDGALFPHLDVAANIGFGLDRAACRREARIRDLMAIVELDAGMARRRPHELSGGQQQRVALARALARQPRLMLLDEPFSALDTGLRETMRKAVADVLRAAGITAVLVTHDQTEAMSFADQVAILREGRLVQAGAPQELYRAPRDSRTATFLGDAIIMSAELGDGAVQCALGRLPADTRGRRGAADIMVRPEQLRLTAVTPRAGDAACRGHVTDVEFGGAASTVCVVLEEGPDPISAGPVGTTLRIRTASIDLPRPGSIVSIAVVGAVHIFDRPDASGSPTPEPAGAVV